MSKRLMACGMAVGLWVVADGWAEQTATEEGERTEAAAESWELVEEEWSVLELAGSKAGHVHWQMWKSGELYRTDLTTKMSMGRVGDASAIEMFSSTVETAEGKAVEMRAIQKTSHEPVTTVVKFGASAAEMVVEEAGKETKKSLPLPSEPWLTPRAIDRFMKKALEEGRTEISFATVDLSAGLNVMHVKGKLVGPKKMTVNGEEVEVTEWDTISDLMPVKTAAFHDAEGRAVEVRIKLGIGELVTRRATKEEALAGAEGLAEVLVPSFVKPDRALPDMRTAKALTLRVKTKDGGKIDLPQAGAQRVEVGEGGAEAVVRVQLAEGSAATEEEEAVEGPYLEASGPISADDELVKKLASSAVRGAMEKDANAGSMAKAEAMRTRAYRHISKKDFRTAFASAAETAKTRTGDCSEHAVLLCAMLRSQGIAARVATGLVHVDDGTETGFFGWHMWTQGVIDGKWMDFDATLPDGQRYHVGHILTAVSTMADDAPLTELTAVVALLGNVEISVGSEGSP